VAEPKRYFDSIGAYKQNLFLFTERSLRQT
jgi:hypothetical protein